MVPRHSVFITLLFITCLVIIIVHVNAADDALTRGSRFSINITGSPSTPYYIWLTRTSTMTGKPGDQPPVIVAFQSGIQQDPPEGPYTIGSYMINNGNGRTIRDDIAPSTPELSNTNYYALVTTGTDGRAIVAFQTTSGTATRTFSVKVENHRSAANSDIFIERGLSFKIPTTAPPESPVITPAITNTPGVIQTESPSATTIILTTIPAPILTSAQRSAIIPVNSIIAIVAGLLVWSRKEFFR
ncbi:MAG: hypothetical protein M0Q91_07200 [Methanoregula sp.]|jgi:hypothetical protein|nr:hypothetical protein [Methanoregula sp.]